MRGAHISPRTAQSPSSRAAAPAPGLRRPGFTTSLLWNAAALGALWFLYSAVRTLTADSWSAARSNADRLLAFEDSIGLPSEAVFQRLILDYEWLVRSANVYYLGMHFPSMIAFLLWALFLKRDAMPRIRLALISSTLVGLVIHLAFPLAPPRMLRFGGFVDTASIFGPDPYALGIAKAANELAAMPSMHVGWALLIAVAVVKLTRSRWRWVVVAHPVITTVVVVVTANHYWIDIAVGAALGSLGWWIAGLVRPAPGAEPALALVGLSTDDSDVDAYEVDAYEVDAYEVDAYEVGAHEVGAHEVGAHEVGAHEVGAHEVGAHEVDSVEVRV